MSLARENRKSPTLTERLSKWYGRVMQLPLDRGLEIMSEAEVKRIADDIGVSAAELPALNRHGPEAADLLAKRMAALNLDGAEVSREFPVTLHDMQRLCTLCAEKGKCERDLRRHPDDTSWKIYCPNAEALGDLNAMPWKSRNEW